jgi:hypothetical protein
METEFESKKTEDWKGREIGLLFQVVRAIEHMRPEAYKTV